MTDKKFTDEEIVKALECCLCDDSECLQCQKKELCKINCDELATKTIDLINRQKSEIERLKETPKCVYEYDGEVTEYCVQGPCSNFKTVEQIKADQFETDDKQLFKIVEEACRKAVDVSRSDTE